MHEWDLRVASKVCACVSHKIIPFSFNSVVNNFELVNMTNKIFVTSGTAKIPVGTL